MKLFQFETQLSNFKYVTCCCLPGALRRLSCFRGLATQHHRIKESTELRCSSYNPGIVAKLMGLDSIPRSISSIHSQQDHNNSNSRSPSNRQTPMVLELEKGKFFFLGLEAGCKVSSKGDSRSDSRRKLLEGDGSKKKETSKEVSKRGANVDFDLEFFDQMVLELVYIF